MHSTGGDKVEPTTQTVSITSSPNEPGSAIGRALLQLGGRQALPVLIATILLFVVAAVFVPKTLTPASVVAILVPAGISAVAAIGQTLVIQQKGIDLSVGGVMTLAAVASGIFSSNGLPFWLVLLIVAVLSLASGLLNGLLVTRVHITPLLATLASNSLIIGVVWTVSGGQAKLAPEELRTIASGSFLGLPLIAWIALILVVIVAIVMSKSLFGRRFTAVGSSPAAALAGGVNVRGYILFSYVIAGAFGGLAGLLLAGYAGQTTYDLGVNYMLPVIAAVVIGGAALTGGRGSVVATAFGCLLLSLVVQMVLTLGAPTSMQLLVQSLVLAVAAGIRLFPWSRVGALLRSRRRAPA